jgi:hypothetical protein
MDINLRNNIIIRSALLVVVLVQVGQMTPLSAEIFKCTSKAGKVFYNDKPCPSLDDEKKMRSEKDVVNGYVPPADKEDKKVFKKGDRQFSNEKLKPVIKTKIKKKSKAENIPKSQRLNGSGNRREKVAEEAGIEPRSNSKIVSKGNYSDRERTIEDKRIYLGIRKQVE